MMVFVPVSDSIIKMDCVCQFSIPVTNNLRWSVFKRVKFCRFLSMTRWSFALGTIEGAHLHCLLWWESRGKKRKGKGVLLPHFRAHSQEQRPLMVNLVCFSESAMKQEKHLCVYVGLFPQRFNQVEMDHPQFGLCRPTGCHPRLNNNNRE